MSKFIADTSIWSPFLRKSSGLIDPYRDRLRQGIVRGEVQMLGIIRQECLSGIRENAQYLKLKEILDGFPDDLATSDDHLKASEFFNDCRKKGVQGGAADFLICAQSVRLGIPVLTVDKDFVDYSKHIPISLVPAE
ncbi:MAG: PIN domain-containing protein [Verrucomicrobiota bacterium]